MSSWKDLGRNAAMAALRDEIIGHLTVTRGNVSAAALCMRVSRSHFYELARKCGVSVKHVASALRLAR